MPGRLLPGHQSTCFAESSFTEATRRSRFDRPSLKKTKRAARSCILNFRIPRQETPLFQGHDVM